MTKLTACALPAPRRSPSGGSSRTPQPLQEMLLFIFPPAGRKQAGLAGAPGFVGSPAAWRRARLQRPARRRDCISQAAPHRRRVSAEVCLDLCVQQPQGTAVASIFVAGLFITRLRASPRTALARSAVMLFAPKCRAARSGRRVVCKAGEPGGPQGEALRLRALGAAFSGLLFPSFLTTSSEFSKRKGCSEVQLSAQNQTSRP